MIGGFPSSPVTPAEPCSGQALNTLGSKALFSID